MRTNQKNASNAIVKLNLTKNFELKEDTMQLVQHTYQYKGKPHKDPHKNLLEFIELSNNFYYQNILDEYMKLTLFSFSLIREIKQRSQNKPARSIIYWDIFLRSFSTSSSHIEEQKSLKEGFSDLFKNMLNPFPQGRDTRD